MLTDYHLHLRPDDPDTTPAAEYFTAANVDRYRAVAEEHGVGELGVAEHVYRFTAALDVWRHPFWVTNARDGLDAYCAWVREETDLKLGIEADFLAGREDRMANLLDGYDWDYVVGSVHFVGAESLDTEEYSIWLRETSPERIWKSYFETLGEAAQTGLFDIL